MEPNNKTVKKTKGNYIFPNLLGKMMKGVSQQTQFEAELMSIACILIGIIIMSTFTVFFTNQSIFVKIMVSFNCAAAFVFLSSRLVTSFQQYNTYLAAMGFLSDWNEGENQKLK